MSRIKILSIAIIVVLAIIMSTILLSETPIETNPNLVSKDGSDLQNVKNAVIGTAGGAFIEIKDGAINANDGTTNRVILGQYGSFNGLKVSKATKDVKTASISDLIFSSDNNTFKIFATGTLSVSTGATPDIPYEGDSFTHNLGYIPTVIAFIDGGGGAYNAGNMLPAMDFEVIDGYLEWKIYMSVTDTDITLMALIPTTSAYYAAGINRTVRYYILVEQG